MGRGALVVPSFFLSAFVGSASAFGLAGGGGSGGSLPVLSAGRAWDRRGGTHIFGLHSPSRQARRPGLSSMLPIGGHAATWVGRHRRHIASGHVLFSTSDDDDDDDDDDDAATDDASGPRRGGRRKVSDEELGQRKEQLRKLLRATKAEIDQLVSNSPNVLFFRDVVKNHAPKVAMLQERLGIDQKAAGRMCLNASRLLNSKLETLVSKIDWLQARLNLSKTQLKTILTRAPGTLTLSIDDNIQPNLDNMQSGLEMSDKELTEMVVQQPALLFNNFSTEKLAARMSFLQNLLNIEENDIASLRKTVKRRPDILHWSEDNMLETQHWISERLGLSDSRIAQMCRNQPFLLTAKVTTLEDKVDWAQAALSLSDEELGKLFGQNPGLFSCCPKKNLDPKLLFLRLAFDLRDEQLKELLLKVPNLLGLSEAIIEEKLQFYSELVGKREAKRIVMESTNLLLPSLKKRLRPRLAEVEKAGIEVEWTAQLIQRLARRSGDCWGRYGLGEAPKGRPPSSNSS